MRWERFSSVLLIAVALVGCGGDQDGGAPTGPDPAGAIPAGALVYIEAVVRPTGEQRDNARGLLERFLGDTTLVELIDKGLADEGRSFAEDVEPWLGERAGVAFYDLASDVPDAVQAYAITDAEAAEAFVSDAEKRGTVGDIQVYLTAIGFVGVTEDFYLVASSEDRLRRAIDTVDATSFAEDQDFKDAYLRVPSERLGAIYIDTQGFLEAAVAADPTVDPTGRAVLEQVFGEFDGAESITGALVTEPDSARLEVRVSGEGFGSLGALVAGESSKLVTEAPADSWLVLGYADVGSTFRTAIDKLGGAFGGAVVTGQFEAQTGLDLEQDLLSWIGDLSLFVRGETLDTLNGAVVVEVTDTDAVEAAIPRIIDAARPVGAPVREVPISGADTAFAVSLGAGAPGPLVMAYNEERAVFAVGERAAEDALEPSETISDTDLFEDAEASLDGIAPAFVVDVATALALAELSGVTDATFEAARPYLEMVDFVASGTEAPSRAVVAVMVDE